ncbi:hypothetical protein O988_04422 [Pseudogymnoascus sp. VKM F-3808]|nr:hypothetical protein O988_04422 [Pseudogymnoascus sp. VKM F-3808]
MLRHQQPGVLTYDSARIKRLEGPHPTVHDIRLTGERGILNYLDQGIYTPVVALAADGYVMPLLFSSEEVAAFPAVKAVTGRCAINVRAFTDLGVARPSFPWPLERTAVSTEESAVIDAFFDVDNLEARGLGGVEAQGLDGNDCSCHRQIERVWAMVVKVPVQDFVADGVWGRVPRHDFITEGVQKNRWVPVDQRYQLSDGSKPGQAPRPGEKLDAWLVLNQERSDNYPEIISRVFKNFHEGR